MDQLNTSGIQHSAWNGCPVHRVDFLFSSVEKFSRRSGLFERLEILYDIVRVGGAAQPAERHPVSLHLGLWVGNVLPQIGFVPGEVRPLHRIGIAEVLEGRRLPADNTLQAGPKRIRLFVVAGEASCKKKESV